MPGQSKSFLDTLSPEERVQFLQGFFTSGGTPPAAEQSARADLLAWLLGEQEPDAAALKAWQSERFRQVKLGNRQPGVRPVEDQR